MSLVEFTGKVMSGSETLFAAVSGTFKNKVLVFLLNEAYGELVFRIWCNSMERNQTQISIIF